MCPPRQGVYLLISSALDLFSLVSVLQASSRYSTNADAFLAAVEALAGPDSATGLAVVDKAVKAVNVRRVIAVRGAGERWAEGGGGGWEVWGRPGRDRHAACLAAYPCRLPT